MNPKTLKDASPAGRHELIDALRGVAVLFVIWHHLGVGFLFQKQNNPLKETFMGSWFGVELFFVISGFVISSMLLPKIEAARSRGWQDFKAVLKVFYTQRAFRLLPLCGLFIGLHLVSKEWFHPGFIQREKWLPLELLAILGNAHNFFLNSGKSSTFPWQWSLAIEEQFYLAFPVALIFIRSKKARLWLCLSAIALITLVFRPWAVAHGAQIWPHLRTQSLLKFDSILFGVALYLVTQRPRPQRTWPHIFEVTFTPRFFCGLSLTSLLLVHLILGNLPSLYFPAINLFCVISVFFATQDSSPSRFGVSRFLALIGRRSYILYLAQIPVFYAVQELATHSPWDTPWARIFMAAAILLPLTEFCYRCIEQPLIHRGKQLTSKWIPPQAAQPRPGEADGSRAA